MNIFDRHNTNAIRAVAALVILVCHVLIAYSISPVFNLWGGLAVCMFLILSGYGLNESYKRNALEGFWTKRWNRVILPTVLFIMGYNFVYPESSWQNFFDELLYLKPTFWFVFHILKCYCVYFVAMRWRGGRWCMQIMAAFALLCLFTKAPCGHQEAEQAFSFMFGVMLSRNREWVDNLPKERLLKYMWMGFTIGLACFVLKMIPAVHSFKGTIPYNLILMPFRLSWGVAFIILLSLCTWLRRSRMIDRIGDYSLEIYIAHIPFIGLIDGCNGLLRFVVWSGFSFVALVLVRRFVIGKVTIAQLLMVVVNALFVAKYSMRLAGGWYVLLTMAFAIVYLVFLMVIVPRLDGSSSRQKAAMVLSVVLFVVMIALQYGIDPYTLNVDRWSALHFPIRNLLHGEYPYLAHTHLGGYASPFPVWQILHIPFYLLGNVGLSLFVTMALFVWSVYHVDGKAAACRASVLLMTSVCVWYEAAVRSDMMTNMLLVASLIEGFKGFQRVSEGSKGFQKVSEGCWLVVAVCTALLACTRLVVLIPIGMVLLPSFLRMRRSRQVMFVVTFLLVYALTFVPFALWDWNAFFHHQFNPWTLQTRQGHWVDFVLFVPMAAVLALRSKEGGIAVMLFVFVVVTLVHVMYDNGNWDLFSNMYDITYLDMCIPFCIMSI